MPPALPFEVGEADQLAAISSRISFPHTDVFTSVQTVADFSDAVRLMMCGSRVSCEPIAGVIAAFTRPCRITCLRGFPEETRTTITRRVKANAEEKVTTNKRGWTISMIDTPASIANGVAEILACSEWQLDLLIDLTRIEPGRGAVICAALTGLCSS